MAGRDPAASAEVPAPQGYGRARSPDVCPHLRSLEGPWRVQHASRDHRCALLARDARLATSHQKAYCLTPAHRTCPINVPLADQASRRHVATAPVLVEHGVAAGVAAAAPVIRDAARGGARLARGLLIALLVAGAGLAFLLARGPLAPNPAAQPTGAAGSAGASIGSIPPTHATSTGAATTRTPAPSTPTPTPRPTPARASPRPSASTARAVQVASGAYVHRPEGRHALRDRPEVRHDRCRARAAQQHHGPDAHSGGAGPPPAVRAGSGCARHPAGGAGASPHVTPARRRPARRESARARARPRARAKTPVGGSDAAASERPLARSARAGSRSTGWLVSAGRSGSTRSPRGRPPG